jgi:hypothetical protein
MLTSLLIAAAAFVLPLCDFSVPVLEPVPAERDPFYF